ncbi:hypothetical protein GF1_06530 [Desulfolithobacter dissulfuricans]|uniref:DUF1104 domain-containing protein n=1 Tax=Desulfolithobacter dissulfuricans TaxID=2795293 RepID=A0A915XJ41_9BACT|nr:DUF1104 domain-containing protein [Desulfolithobacter dissulfuricans]BCO08277.1 hypothetical protein GF1_06530 [Desulfolithobacter dissulfuricans]
MVDNIRKSILVGLGIIMLSGPAWAVTDYSSMSTDELAGLQGTMRQTTVEERNAFRDEWRSRLQQMSPEERQQYTSGTRGRNRAGMGAENMGSGYGTGDGSGRQRGRQRGGGRW